MIRQATTTDEGDSSFFEGSLGRSGASLPALELERRKHDVHSQHKACKRGPTTIGCGGGGTFDQATQSGGEALRLALGRPDGSRLG